MELQQKAIVQSGGRIELTFPSLTPGQTVEVTVRANGAPSPASRPPRAGFGFARGQIQLSDDFDAPLEDFRDYT